MFPILSQVPRPQSPTFLGIKGINTHPFFLNIEQISFTPCLGAYRPPTLRVFVTSVVRGRVGPLRRCLLGLLDSAPGIVH